MKGLISSESEPCCLQAPSSGIQMTVITVLITGEHGASVLEWSRG